MSFLIGGQKRIIKEFFSTTGLGTRMTRMTRMARWLAVCQDPCLEGFMSRS